MIILSGKITDNNEDGVVPTVTLLHNPLGIVLTVTRPSAGTINIVSDKAVISNDMPPKWYVADAAGSRYSVSQISATVVEVVSYSNDGTPGNGILYGNFFEVEVY